MADNENDHPYLRCYEGSDPNSPLTREVGQKGGVTFFDERTGRAAYHVVAAPRWDGVDAALSWLGNLLPGPKVDYTTRIGDIQQSQLPTSPYYDPAKIAGRTGLLSARLQFSQNEDQKKPQLFKCEIENVKTTDPDSVVEVPVIINPPKLQGPEKRSDVAPSVLPTAKPEPVVG